MTQLLVTLPDGTTALCEQLGAWMPFEHEGEPLAWCEATHGSSGVMSHAGSGRAPRLPGGALRFDRRLVVVRHRASPARMLGADVTEAAGVATALEVLRAHGGVAQLRSRIGPARKRRREAYWFDRLEELGFVPEAQIMSFLSQQYRIPTIDLGAYEVPAETLALVGRDLCERHRVLPVSLAGGSVVVAMVDPVDDAALAALRAATYLAIEPVITSELALAAALARYYG